MAEYESARPETPLDIVERLARSGTPIQAIEKETFRGLIEAGRINPYMIIGHRMRIEQQLDSGSLRIVTADYINPLAVGVLTEHEENPVIGEVTIQIVTDRGFEFLGRTVPSQYTELGIAIATDGSKSVNLGASIPFDAITEEDTRQEWIKWGLELNYFNSEKGGYFCFTPQFDGDSPEMEATIVAALKSLEQ